LLGSKLLLNLEVDCDSIIGLDYELALEQVMSTCTKTLYFRSHLLFLNGVPPLGVIELLAFKANGMTFFH